MPDRHDAQNKASILSHVQFDRKVAIDLATTRAVRSCDRKTEGCSKGKPLSGRAPRGKNTSAENYRTWSNSPNEEMEEGELQI